MVAAAGWLVIALVEQEQVLNELARRRALDNSARDNQPGPGSANGDPLEGASLRAQIPAALHQLAESPGERPRFFDDVIDLWFLCRLQNVTDDDFVAALEPDLEQYLAAYAAQLRTVAGHPEHPVRAHDHFLRGLLRGIGLAGQRESAIRDLTLAIDTYDGHDSALHTRGRLYYELGRYDEAVTDLQGSLAINVERWSGWYWLARTLDALHRTDEAEVAWAEARARAPADRADEWRRDSD